MRAQRDLPQLGSSMLGRSVLRAEMAIASNGAGEPALGLLREMHSLVVLRLHIEGLSDRWCGKIAGDIPATVRSLTIHVNEGAVFLGIHLAEILQCLKSLEHLRLEIHDGFDTEDWLRIRRQYRFNPSTATLRSLELVKPYDNFRWYIDASWADLFDTGNLERLHVSASPENNDFVSLAGLLGRNPNLSELILEESSFQHPGVELDVDPADVLLAGWPSKLRKLTLGTGYLELASVLKMLAASSGLEELEVECGVTEGLLRTLAGMPRLRDAIICGPTVGEWEAELLQDWLPRLRRLERLSVCGE
ncbi:hypothetical protein DFJ74DRAFT_692832 [Hyaloraphidium curvatum]|nr:hypothetical protein DFJ74DRAFT_692832 [Hyaloraphidium curvatum]